MYVQLLVLYTQDICLFFFLVQNEWSYYEMSALAEYIAFYHASVERFSKEWPTHNNVEFWGACADAVNSLSSGYNRTGECDCLVFVVFWNKCFRIT